MGFKGRIIQIYVARIAVLCGAQRDEVVLPINGSARKAENFVAAHPVLGAMIKNNLRYPRARSIRCSQRYTRRAAA